MPKKDVDTASQPLFESSAFLRQFDFMRLTGAHLRLCRGSEPMISGLLRPMHFAHEVELLDCLWNRTAPERTPNNGGPLALTVAQKNRMVLREAMREQLSAHGRYCLRREVSRERIGGFRS